MIWKNALALQRDYGAGAGTASDDQMVSMRGLPNCPHRSACCQAKDIAKPKEVVLKKTFWEMRAASQENITTEHGISLRMCRSIQVEGAFGLLKNDFGFRRFLTRGKANIRTELFFLALAYDLKKLWMKRENRRLKTRLSEITVA